MTEVLTFRAATMQEALDRVREELGADAVILHTRQVSQRRLLPWKKPIQEVEITAGIDTSVPARVKTPLRPANTVSMQASHPMAKGTNGTSLTDRLPQPVDTLEISQHLKTAAPSRVITPAPKSPSVSPATAPPRPAKPRSSTPHAGKSYSETQPPVAPKPQVPRRPLSTGRHPLSQQQTTQHISPPKATPPPHRLGSVKSQGLNVETTRAFEEKLNSIQRVLENLERVRHNPSSQDIPDELFQLYADLIDSDVAEELARQLITRLKAKFPMSQLRNVDMARTLLTGLVESDLNCCGPIAPTPNRRKVVALVGPTGVGKTTTIAKLAANFRLRDNIRMSLVTVDTYRIAAVEQLRTYAEIIDLPMKIVTSPQEMRRAMDEFIGLDLVLIDTAGRSPRDDLKIQELKSILAEADVDEVHLVMSLTSSLKGLETTARNFAQANTTSMVLTKLDEAIGMGALLSLSQRVRLPISYLTTGQDVPDDIEPAIASRISRLVLGQDQLHSR